MIVKWEKNSRVNRLAAEGKIRDEDIIPRTQTDKFPMEAATVRLANVKDKNPFITIHIRGPKEQTKSWNGNNGYHHDTFVWATTCRVNLGGFSTFSSKSSNASKTMNSNGELHQDYNWQDVHNIVTKVKEAMEI